MPTITFSFDTGTKTVAQVADAFATATGYQATINGQPNPQTKAQHAREQVRKYIVRTIKVYDAEQATKAATAAIADTPLT